MAQPLVAALVVMSLLPVGACHYGLVRTDAPFGHRRIAVLPAQEAAPLGLAPDLTRALMTALSAGGVQVVHQPADGQAVLSTLIEATRTVPSSATAGVRARIPSYALQVQVRATLADTAGAELWSATLHLTEEFLPSPASLGDAQSVNTEANRRRAARRIADRAAQTLVRRLVMAGGGANES